MGENIVATQIIEQARSWKARALAAEDALELAREQARYREGELVRSGHQQLLEAQSKALDTIQRIAAQLPVEPIIDAEVVVPDVEVDTWFGEDDTPVVQIDTHRGHGRLRINLNDGVVWDGDHGQGWVPPYTPRAAVPDAAIRELTEAIRLTVEYVGNDMLPAIEGWDWYDALVKYAPEVAQAFVDKPIHFPKPTDAEAERDAALAAIERIREAVSGHPECDRYSEDDVISCGWKSAYASVVAALDGAPEPTPDIADCA